MRAVALIGLWMVVGAAPAVAQEDLGKGKTLPQLFASDCAICHKDRKNLGTSMRAGQLSTFLAQHYTTSKEQAAALAGYLVGKAEPERRPRRSQSRAK